MVGYRLSRTGLAERPFYIASVGVNIWSIEELCFFLSRNAALIDDGIVSPSLTRWLTEEFHLTQTALKMEQGMKGGRGAADFILPLFTATNYLSAQELRGFTASLRKVQEATPAGRQKMKADALVRNRRFGEAIAVYHRAEESGQHENAHFHAAVCRNCGVAAMRLMEYEEALMEFRKAVQLDDTRANRTAYLTALRLAKPEEKYRAEAAELGADDALLEEVDRAVYRAMETRREAPEGRAELRAALDSLRETYHREAGT